MLGTTPRATPCCSQNARTLSPLADYRTSRPSHSLTRSESRRPLRVPLSLEELHQGPLSRKKQIASGHHEGNDSIHLMASIFASII